MRGFLFALLALVVSNMATPVAAHEVRPGYIELTELARDSYAVIWKQPVRNAGREAVAGLGLRPVFPENCTRLSDSNMQRRPGVLIERFSLACQGGLMGQQIGVEGLRKTITDVFVHLQLIDGKSVNLRLTAQEPVASFAGGGAGLVAYFGLGVEHLVFGFDHILFVLGLVMLVRGEGQKWRRLIYVITAFTLAHSITLALSMLADVSAPSAVVEAIIALSILFLAVELVQKPENRSPLASRYPQAVAFGFGLLHGFGFAGVLGDIGLPRDLAIAALALFNVGLEIGQLMVIAAALFIGKQMQPIIARQPLLAEVPIVLIGGVSVYWLIERAVPIWAG